MLKRAVFSTPRTAEFLELGALQSQTGQPVSRFGDVVIKELLDNALDAAETAGQRPQVGLGVTLADADGVVYVSVTDNGPGLPGEVIERILDFNNTVSDKASLRSPTRGMQGNAFKTLLGIPYALRVTAPVVIEALGVRHEIAVRVDPIDGVAIDHTQTPSPRTVGTRVSVPMPAHRVTRATAAAWLQKFALFNPHAYLFEHGHESGPEGVDFYEPTAGERWRKPMPTDATSAHHYDQAALTKLVYGHIREHQHGGKDLPLGAFVTTFAGLTASARAKKVAAAVPGITHLSGFKDQPERIGTLLAAMKENSKPSKAADLGQISRDHYLHVIDQAFGLDQGWFARKQLTDDAGIPWVIEVTCARTLRPGTVSFGVNYSATFGDPLNHTRLTGDHADSFGAHAFLGAHDAAPYATNQQLRAAVVHLICPAPQFTDKGKTALAVPREVAEACAQAFASAAKALHKAQESHERARTAQEKAQIREAQRAVKEGKAVWLTKKEAVFRVLPEAIRQVRGGASLSFSSHTLYYKIRPLALKLIKPGSTLDASYVEQTLIPAWEREHGPIAGLYREPRGTLHHPHDTDGERDLRLGTLAVAQYVPPRWNYNKILVIEKTGLWPPIRQARIAERYDMAVVLTEGYGTAACRDLLAKLPAGQVQIFVLHDADPDGYNIARTLGEETVRMPDHHVEIIDLGLHVEHAQALRLETEPFIRHSALPAGLEGQLSPTALTWFTGEPISTNHRGQAKRWQGKRVELNAFSSPELITYIKEQLAHHGATGKVIPPDHILRDTAAASIRAHARRIVDEAITEVIRPDDITQSLYASLDIAQLTTLTGDDIVAHLDAHPHHPWDASVSNIVLDRVGPHRAELKNLARQLLAEQGAPGDR
ncbi:ATP-binding protein [Streptacidiphilus sp. MAP5-3]|uniref:ATP-binding protein n=1 Tax=unclassified Streptacidiphilus TaxID=2643834 RepID=UPI003517DD73